MLISDLRPLLPITFPQGLRKSKIFGHWTLGSGGKKTFKRNLKKVIRKNNFFRRGDFTLFMSKKIQICDHLFPLHFPNASGNLKSLDIGL